MPSTAPPKKSTRLLPRAIPTLILTLVLLLFVASALAVPLVSNSERSTNNSTANSTDPSTNISSSSNNENTTSHLDKNSTIPETENPTNSSSSSSNTTSIVADSNSTSSGNSTTKPTNTTIDSSNSTANSGNSTTPSGNSTVGSSNSTATSGNSTTTPSNSTIGSSNSTATSGNSTSTPSNSTIGSSNSTATSGNSTTTPSNSTIGSSNSTATSGNSTSTPGNSTVGSSNSTTSSGNSTTTLGNSTVGSSNSTATSGNSTTTAGNSTVDSSNSTNPIDAPSQKCNFSYVVCDNKTLGCDQGFQCLMAANDTCVPSKCSMNDKCEPNNCSDECLYDVGICWPSSDFLLEPESCPFTYSVCNLTNGTCAEGYKCSQVSGDDPCVPSECTFDAHCQVISCSEDCLAGHGVCLPVDYNDDKGDENEDDGPPCPYIYTVCDGVNKTCDDGFECIMAPNETCVSSVCSLDSSCEPFVCTMDCMMGVGTCKPVASNDTIGPVPDNEQCPYNYTVCDGVNKTCSDGFECVMADNDTCVSSACSLSPKCEKEICTMDCLRGVGTCQPVASNTTIDPIPSSPASGQCPYNYTVCDGVNKTCRDGFECVMAENDTCVSSACSLNAKCEKEICTMDCLLGVGTCKPIASNASTCPYDYQLCDNANKTCAEGFECKFRNNSLSCVSSICKLDSSCNPIDCTDDCVLDVGTCIPLLDDGDAKKCPYAYKMCSTGDDNITCDAGFECIMQGDEKCVSSVCQLDGDCNPTICTMDCNLGYGICRPSNNSSVYVVDPPPPSCSYNYTLCDRENNTCDTGFQCIMPNDADTCVPSSCYLDAKCEPLYCTKDCRRGVGVCRPIPQVHEDKNETTSSSCSLNYTLCVPNNSTCPDGFECHLPSNGTCTPLTCDLNARCKPINCSEDCAESGVGFCRPLKKNGTGDHGAHHHHHDGDEDDDKEDSNFVSCRKGSYGVCLPGQGNGTGNWTFTLDSSCVWGDCDEDLVTKSCGSFNASTSVDASGVCKQSCRYLTCYSDDDCHRQGFVAAHGRKVRCAIGDGCSPSLCTQVAGLGCRGWSNCTDDCVVDLGICREVEADYEDDANSTDIGNSTLDDYPANSTAPDAASNSSSSGSVNQNSTTAGTNVTETTQVKPCPYAYTPCKSHFDCANDTWCDKKSGFFADCVPSTCKMDSECRPVACSRDCLREAGFCVPVTIPANLQGSTPIVMDDSTTPSSSAAPYSSSKSGMIASIWAGVPLVCLAVLMHGMI